MMWPTPLTYKSEPTCAWTCPSVRQMHEQEQVRLPAHSPATHMCTLTHNRLCMRYMRTRTRPPAPRSPRSPLLTHPCTHAHARAHICTHKHNYLPVHLFARPCTHKQARARMASGFAGPCNQAHTRARARMCLHDRAQVHSGSGRGRAEGSAPLCTVHTGEHGSLPLNLCCGETHLKV